jgi:chemotaxis protein CheD
MIRPEGVAPRPVRPPGAPEFAHVNRYWDAGRGLWTAKILPGEFYATGADEGIVTVLGSCVSACIRDPVLRIGGMNHFMLPERSCHAGDAWDATGVSVAARYGTDAMEQLINALLRAGARRDRLEVKLAGGGQILERATDVGRRNIEFVQRFVATEELRLVASDLGLRQARKVLYLPESGRMLVRRLESLHNDTLVRRERGYVDTLARAAAGPVELF